jgi:2-dehydro-3-deoxyphosphogluconate aldolase/(4S)-4-hydroxy-2-oxoglutarate aldolase
VNVDDMNEYVSLPEVFAVGGSWIASKRQVADKQWSVIAQQAREALARALGVAG